MKLISWNVNGRIELARERQQRALLKRTPDVIALQEVTRNSYPAWCEGLSARGYSVVSTRELVDLPYPPPAECVSPPFPTQGTEQIRRRFFNLIASRYPITPLKGLEFQDPDEARFAFPEKHLAARLLIGEQAVEIHNTHLPPGVSRGVVKVHAFEAIRRRVDSRTPNPRILCGDFNAPLVEDSDGPVIERGGNWPDEIQDRWVKAETRLLINPALPDVYRTTHPRARKLPASHFTRGGPRRYDYIFASDELPVVSCAYIQAWLERDVEKRRLSDHAGVQAVFTV